MCTLSWLYSDRNYEVHFNRDERRSRPIAIPPKDSQSAIYPTDPQGGGSWISTNKYGLSLALINNYGAEMALHRTDAISRGQIIKAYSEYQSVEQLEQELAKGDWKNYNPFDLFVFSPNTAAVRLRWDGVNTQLDNPQRQVVFRRASTRMKR